MKEKLIIIGSGPAAYTAAIYASRAELSPIVIEGRSPGGQLMTTTEVENFPGFPQGTNGPELVDLIKKQAVRFKARFIADDVEKVDFSVKPFKLWTSDKEFEAEAVIIATGASAKWLGVPGEEKYKGHGVSACATCDGFFFRDQEVIVVGGGDAAMEEATFLTKFATKVTVMVRSDVLKASKIMQEKAKANRKIEFMWNTEVKEVLGGSTKGSQQEGKMTAVKIINNKTGEESEFKASGMFVAIGHKPNTDFLNGQLDLIKGYIVVDPGRTLTSVEGVFAAGDVQDYIYRQAVTAAGSGCMAALDTEKYLAAK